MSNFKVRTGLGRHLISAACLVFVLAATTSAYSIVMRGGKRIEIPSQFSVTNSTLSYETAPGFWITLQMAAVDIPATEKANNELPGTLMGRAIKQNQLPGKPEVIDQARDSKASRTVTNLDLESFKDVRLKSERAYEQRLKEQGLPPLAVLRAQAAAEAKRFSQELAQQIAEAEANERTAQLQAQIAALNAQLNEIQSRTGEFSAYSPDVFTVYGGVPFYGGRSRVNPSLFRVPPGLPIGGAFGSFNAQFGAVPFHGFRRNIIVAPGTRFGGHGGHNGGNSGGHNGGPRGGQHGGPRSH